MNNIYDIFEKLDERNILLSFKGMITPDLLTTILQIMESKLDSYDEKPKIKKKVFNILVECLQNLYHHIDKDIVVDETTKRERAALLMIARKESQYQIMTGNYMETSDVESLREKLDFVNSMNKDDLKAYYKEVLNDGNRTAKGTAGLGMVDIARKSGRKLGYHFLEISPELSFFSLTVTVSE
ncbi:MAG: SiaB family protein kinase [Crocinitomicaceae bacterium]